jgi:L-iditol 2-dehydrogenase
MLAIRKLARGIGNIEVQDVPEPSAGPDQVVIKVDSAGICGTDLHIYLDEFETRPPVTIGHEVAGRIVEVGRDVTGWKEGDRVTTPKPIFILVANAAIVDGADAISVCSDARLAPKKTVLSRNSW